MIVVFISGKDVILRISQWCMQYYKIRQVYNIKYCVKKVD